MNRPPFTLMDALRRVQADAPGAFGLGPGECEYRVLAATPCWRLRAIYLGRCHVVVDRPEAELAEIECWRTKALADA